MYEWFGVHVSGASAIKWTRACCAHSHTQGKEEGETIADPKHCTHEKCKVTFTVCELNIVSLFKQCAGWGGGRLSMTRKQAQVRTRSFNVPELSGVLLVPNTVGHVLICSKGVLATTTQLEDFHTWDANKPKWEYNMTLIYHGCDMHTKRWSCTHITGLREDDEQKYCKTWLFVILGG